MSRRSGAFFLSLLALVVAAGFAATVFLPELRQRVWRREVQSGSVSVLTGIRDLAELETLVYVRRTVFPHDYLQDHLSITALHRRIAAEGTTAAEALSREELLHLRGANLAASLGLLGADGRATSDFVVVTTAIYLGFSMEELIAGLEGVGDEDGPGAYTLPPAQVLAIRTEDVQRENYPYPAIRLDADGWRRVTTFVEETVLAAAPLDELRRSAAEQAARFLNTVVTIDVLAQ